METEPALPKRKTFKRVLNRIRGRTLASAEPGSFLVAKDKVLAMEHELERTLNLVKSNQNMVKQMYLEIQRGNTSADEELLVCFNSQSKVCMGHYDLCQQIVVESISKKLALVQEIKRKCRDELDFAHLQLEDARNKDNSTSQVKLIKQREKLARYQADYDLLSNSIFAVLDQILEDSGNGTALGFIREECVYFKLLQVRLFQGLYETTQTGFIPATLLADELQLTLDNTEDLWEEFRLRCATRHSGGLGFKLLDSSPSTLSSTSTGSKPTKTSPQLSSNSSPPLAAMESKLVLEGDHISPPESTSKFELKKRLGLSNAGKLQPPLPPSAISSTTTTFPTNKALFAFSTKTKEELKRAAVTPPPMATITPPPMATITPPPPPVTTTDKVVDVVPTTLGIEEEESMLVMLSVEDMIEDQVEMDENGFELQDEFEFPSELVEQEPLEEQALEEQALEEVVEMEQLEEEQLSFDFDESEITLETLMEDVSLLPMEEETEIVVVSPSKLQLQQEERLRQQQNKIKQQQLLQHQRQQEQLELEQKLQRQQQRHQEQQRIQREQEVKVQAEQQAQQQALLKIKQQQQHQQQVLLQKQKSQGVIPTILPPSSSPSSRVMGVPIARNRVVAIYDFTAEREGDLSFKLGEELVLTKPASDVGWYFAKSITSGKQGLVPFEGFLKRLLPVVTAPAVPKTRPNNTAPLLPTLKLQAKYAFIKEQAGDLSLQVGDLVVQLNLGPSPEWVFVQNIQTGDQGLVPKDFLEAIPKSSHNFVVMESFSVQQPGDLAIVRGEVVELVSNSPLAADVDWVTVRNSRGIQGLVPLAFLKNDLDAV
ncbi:hypothetical protein BASA81_000293 [Batrachochytrium salamandrivorans]|nr:hypothetical protein BASA81_000293 [Batrachochytrium salamandrivorans]